jgi:hypothetical protein
LEGLGGVPYAEGHEREFQEAKRNGDHGLLVSVSLGKNLVVHGHQETLLTVLIPCIFFRDTKGKDFLCISVACNLIIYEIYYTVLGLMYAFSNYMYTAHNI